MSGNDRSDETETIHLDEQSELSITTHGSADKFNIILVTGSAEIFGSELEADKNYEFSYFSSVAIFTWQGCTIKLKRSSNCRFYETKSSNEVPRMKEVHEDIEKIRIKADKSTDDFPIILLTGPTDVGKSTLTRFLLNYAARKGRSPTFIDLDIGQSSASITGSLSVLTVHEPCNANGKFDEKELSAYFFGYKTPTGNIDLYKSLVKRIGSRMHVRLKSDNHLRTSGAVIDTCGWVEGGGYHLILDIIDLMKVSTVLVISKYSLYRRLKGDVSDRTEFMFVDEFRNVKTRNRNIRITNRDISVYTYFYGSSGRLPTHNIKLHFDDVQIFRYSRNKMYNSINACVVPVSIEPDILYQVLALSYADAINDILLSSVYGFICVMEIDMESKTITLLSPQPAPLPTNYLLMGDITLNYERF